MTKSIENDGDYYNNLQAVSGNFSEEFMTKYLSNPTAYKVVQALAHGATTHYVIEQLVQSLEIAEMKMKRLIESHPYPLNFFE